MPTNPRYTYTGPEYDHTGGVLLPGMIGLPLYPHRMSARDVELILDENPKLRKFWRDTWADSDGDNSDDADDSNSDGLPDWLNPMLMAADVKLKFNRTSETFTF